MVEDRVKKGWKVRLSELDVKQSELRNRAGELENEIGQLDVELASYRIKNYRGELLTNIKKHFIRTFRERDKLIGTKFGEVDDWNNYSRILQGCIVIRDGLASSEADSCRDVSELKGFLRAKLNSEMEDGVEEEVLNLL